MAAEKKTIGDAVSSLDYEDLIELQRDLLRGGISIKQVVSSKLKEITATEVRVCATCGGSINMRVANEFTLIFGPSDFKKRASFCAIDCMEYFTANLKRISAKKVQQSNTDLQ